MKTIYKTIKSILFASALIVNANAQVVSDFENITLTPDSYKNGSDFSGGYQSGNAFFLNHYDTAFGGYWTGFSVSNKKDSTTKGYGNQYSAISGMGYINSANYAVAYSEGMIRLTGAAIGKRVNGLYITNSTYAYWSMKDGDMFARKFGDTTGTNSGLPQGSYPDYFKVIFKGYKNGTQKDSSISFYLADFRSSDNSKDYVLKNWTWCDLTNLGDVDSLRFYFESSDTNSYGIKTPQYFCMDNLSTGDASGIASVNNNLKLAVYPNPSHGLISVTTNEEYKPILISVLDLSGKTVLESTDPNINVSELKEGVYLLKAEIDSNVILRKIVKQ